MASVAELKEHLAEHSEERPVAFVPTLHSLPAELIERVLIFSDPRDVSRYAQTCRFARKLVYEPKDQFLWRELYLGRPFDDLRHAVRLPQRHPVLRFDLTSDGDQGKSTVFTQWRSEVERRIQAEAIAASDDSDAELLRQAYKTFLAAVDTAAPMSESDMGPDGKTILSRSENLRWLDRVLRRTRILDRPISFSSTPSNTLAEPAAVSAGTRSHARNAPPRFGAIAEELHQSRRKLRAYVALSHESSFNAESRARMAEIRRTSRCFVYDMRKYHPETLWGPYRIVHLPYSRADHSNRTASGEEEPHGADETLSESDAIPTSGEESVAGEENHRTTLVVNWEHIEHIMNVVGLKLRDVSDVCLGYYKKPPFTLEALRAYSAVGSFERPPHDWAGVTGKWRRFVCFMDYRDLYMFNYSHLPPGPHHVSFFEDPFDEALRPVELHLSLIPASEYFSDPSQIPHVLPSPAPVTDEAVDDPAFPTLYFEGHSRGPHASVASIRGRVSTLADGAIRWQFVTTYDGRMQWRYVRIHDDPAGPFWMIKVNDKLPDGVLNSLH
ncbi:hypothetical protein BN946_scf184990.g18 [Trametes cinnabarina]|uniref:F-box domain-containing protein n=1 Tax=Pycnoporus cinnabarinus TaxID=5643 RepID=A0A060SED9_PYCCI|nr:hypothetical protein BN946_scf184990.g18 [Trametes cinnabarina]